jgi:cytochrome c oxidase subunit 3
MSKTMSPSSLKTKKENYKIAPAKVNIWLFMLASCMFFAAIVSAFIVHKPDAEAKNLWTVFDLPIYFLFSFITALISSGTIYIAYKAAKQDELEINKLFTGITLFLGVLFCVFQVLGWKQLVSVGLTFVNARPQDISASYVWIITVLHALHVLGGIILLTVTLVSEFKFKVHKKQMTLMSVTHTYWHFVGLLWIYLYLFLYFAR